MQSPSVRYWIKAITSVDAPAETRLQRFVMSARIGLWPAIVLSAFAFAQLLNYPLLETLALAVDLCLIASGAFLFNDLRDRDIDLVNRVHRWHLQTPSDIYLFGGASLSALVVVLASFLWLSQIAAIGVIIAIFASIAYSLVCKRLFLVGNVVAALLSLSPGIIMWTDVQARPPNEGDALLVCALFCGAGFLLLLSREIKFDEFDVQGDQVGGRMTLPMVLGERALSVVHLASLTVSAALLTSALVLGSVVAWYWSAAAMMCGLMIGVLATSAYRSGSKEYFYKKTRIAMLLLPLMILLSAGT